MSYESIKLPVILGIAVAKSLKEDLGIETELNKYGMLDFSFPKELLEMVKTLTLSDVNEETLNKLNVFTNLEKLSICYSSKDNESSKEMIISDRDVQNIEKCKNLNSLKIIGVKGMKSIDVSNMRLLENLVICNNEDLKNIYGLEDLNELKTIEIYGNDKLEEVTRLNNIIVNSANLRKIVLDTILFLDAIGYEKSTGEFDTRAYMNLKSIQTVTFKESFEITRTIDLNLEQMVTLHNKACEILEENVQDSANKRDIIVAIEVYLSRNVAYDMEALKHEHVGAGDECDVVETKYRHRRGPKHSASGSYNALIYNQCLCEGYTRAMQYLLKLKNINSHSVYCFVPREHFEIDGVMQHELYDVLKLADEVYHNIISVDDFNSLYSDPCLNARLYQNGDKRMPFMLRTKDEIEKTHMFFYDESEINNRYFRQSEHALQSAVRNCENVIENKDRNKKYGKVDKIKGQILM